MSFYPKDLDEEALKQRVANDFFAKFAYEPLKKIDFALTQKDDVLNIHYLLWAEAKAGNEADIYESFVQLILTIGVQKIHKEFAIPEFLGAFDCEKIAFLSYAFIKDFLYSGDFNWKKITPSDHKSAEFQKMFALTKDILKTKSFVFDYDKDNKELKEFIKNSLAKSEFNPIIIDADNFDACYLKWCVNVLPNINLKSEVWKKARKQNIALEQDFFLADLISKDNITLNDNLRILLQKRQDDELYYKIKTKEDDLFSQQFNILEIQFIDKKAHHNFWKLYKRPPAEKFWREIFERRDKITPQDIMERKGAFFTPPIWVKKAQTYLKSALGKDFEDYYIWDCAAGTGNLLKGLTNSAKLYASTLDLSDVLIMKDLCKYDRNDTSKKAEEKLNLLENHIFQFDFLNDDFSKLPQNLQDILNDEKKRQKLIVFINPPYAEASSSKTINNTQSKHKIGVSENKTSQINYFALLGRGVNEVFAQFFIRIYKEIPNCILASFSTLKYINSQNFTKFREHFKAKFLKGFICPSNTFDNVKGEFPIGFLIWDTKNKENLKEIRTDIFERNGEFGEQKIFYTNGKNKVILNWLSNYYDQQGNQKSNDRLAYLVRGASDFSNNQIVFIDNQPSQAVINHSQTNDITSKNLIPNCIFFAVRKSIKHTWINHNDQFLYPNNKWQKDTEFQNDCLAFTLFHEKNQISSDEGENHFIPFTENEVNVKEAFKSDFMVKFINGKIKAPKEKQTQKQGFANADFYVNTQSFIPTKPLEFSKEAKAVFEAGREIWRYYHTNDFKDPHKAYNANASLYDIKAHFQGRNDKGRMNARSDDTHYNELMTNLRNALKALAEKITPKIYDYGFLRE